MPELGVLIWATKDLVTKWISQAFIVGTTQVPGFVKNIMPTGTVESQVVQLSALDQYLGVILEKLSESFSNGLKMITGDINVFLEFTKGGRWSRDIVVSVPTGTKGLSSALKTYITSESLKMNLWHAQYVGTCSNED